MDSSRRSNGGHLKSALPKQRDSAFCSPKGPPSALRSQHLSPSSSLSSSSRFSSSSPDDSPRSPATPLRFSRVPFSWEQLPGIPKKQAPKKKDPSLEVLLPLPPPATDHPSSSRRFTLGDVVRVRRKHLSESVRGDPFFAAFVECSKDDRDESLDKYWKDIGASRNFSDRFGFINLNISCKRNCAVSQSIFYLPRSNSTVGEVFDRRPR